MIEISKDALTCFIRVLASAMDAGDPYTHGRAYRCSKYAVRVGRRMGLSEPELQSLEHAGLLQDLAKKLAFHTIRQRPRTLHPLERLQMNQHAQISAEILRRISFLQRASTIIACLNERYDGRGLPNHLRGEEIPLSARILAVVSALDAMVSDRPHRVRLSTEAAYGELRKEARRRFDPRVVDTVIEMHFMKEIAADLDPKMSFLYAVPEADSARPDADDSSPGVEYGTANQQNGPASGFQLLVVDDDEIDRQAIQRAFRGRSLETRITIACDGEEALELLRATASDHGDSHPYLVLLDLNMPRMSGLEFLAELRRDSNLRRSLVFVLSTSDDPRDKRAAYDHNVAGYLVKSHLGSSLSRLPDILEPYLSFIESPSAQALAA